MTVGRHFEAINYALRKSRDGVIVSFVVQPHDVDNALTALPIGARVMIGWCEIGSDEQPVPQPDATPAGAVVAVTSGVADRRDGHKPKRPFKDLSLPEQAGIRANDGNFLIFFTNRHGSIFAAAAQGADEAGAGPQDVAAECIRRYCGVKSRSQLSHDHDAANLWRKLESEYQTHLADRAYGERR